MRRQPPSPRSFQAAVRFRRAAAVMPPARRRARGALLGLAIGDALGMPTQYLPRELIADRYGILDRFHPAPDDNVISRGMAAGKVTDDTDQAVILGRLLVAGKGRLD